MVNKKASTQKWVWRAMIRSAVIPLVLVETVLIAIYLLSNYFIRDANMSYIYQKADAELELSAQRESNIIREQLLSITRQTEVFRSRTQQVLMSDPHRLDIDSESKNLTLTPDGVLYSKMDNGGAASFYSSITPVEKQDKTKIYKLSQLDPLMKEIKYQNPLLAAIYFNAWDSYNHIYPWFKTDKQYSHDMNIPKYNFYYLADELHNPLKNAIWTDVYIDPAGQGWMASCIAPVYNGSFLEGVVGLDVTVDTIIDQILKLAIPWNGYAILVSNNGTIMALPPKGEVDFGLKELTTHTYNEAIKTEQFKPEQFNIYTRVDTKKIGANIKLMKQGKGIVDLRNRKKMIAWTTIPETHWKLLTIVDEKEVYAETNNIAAQFQKIGYLMILGLFIFYCIFMVYIWYSAKKMSLAISRPLDKITKMIKGIEKEEYIQPEQNFELKEIDETSRAIVSMGKKLSEITDDLRLAKADAETANKTKTLFLSSMSHELRTPLNAILGFGQLLQNEQFKITEVQRKEYITEIMTAGNHLLTLIDDVLNLSKIDYQNDQIELQVVKIIDICNECIDMIQPLATSHHLTFSCDLLRQPVAVYGEATRIRQVLLNLLSNAVKYNKPQGHIHLATEVNGHMLRVTVRDSGIGVPENKASQVFQPFNRLGYEASSIEGTGIGLTISKRLIEMMQGTIGFSSKADHGSSFWFELLLKEPVDAESSMSHTETETIQNINDYLSADAEQDYKTVMLVSTDTQLYEQFLESKFDVMPVYASSIEVAFNYLNQEVRPEVILVDLESSIDGLSSFLYQLKDTTKDSHIPIISIADSISALTENANLDAYIDYTIFRPVNVQHAWAVIKKILK